MTLKDLATEAEYTAAMARIEQLFDAHPGTPEGDELEPLLQIAEEYEDRVYPIDIPDPERMRRFRRDQEQPVATNEAH